MISGKVIKNDGSVRDLWLDDESLFPFVNLHLERRCHPLQLR